MPTDEMNFYEEDNSGNIETSVTNDENTSVDSNSVESTEDFTPQSLDLSDVDIGVMVSEDNDTDEDDDILSPEERLHLFSDQIIASCIGKDKTIRKYALDKLLTVTNPRLFRDENYIIFSIFYAYRSKIKIIDIDAEFIKMYLNRNKIVLQKAKGYIDINAYGEVDGSAELAYIAGVMKHFNRLKTFPDISKDEFETYFEKYLIEFKAIEAKKIYNQAQVILTDGMHIGRKFYSGFEDSQNYCKKKLAEIEGLVDLSIGSGFVKMSEVLLDEKPDNKKPELIGDFGKVKPLNDVYGGIYTGTFYSIIAPPKCGKTKFCARLCHNVMLAGNNITVWAQEGGKDYWAAQMRAIHFDYIYNTDVNAVDRKFGVTQEVILHDTFKTPELRNLEMSSKIDLASNKDYGSIDFVDRPFNVETFIDDIDTSVKENNSKLIIIDYLQLMGSSTGMNERERIAEAYKNLLTYCKANNIAVISPAQFKQDSFDDMAKKSSVDDADLRTAAGGSSEVLRTPDILFALWATVDDLRNNSMKIISMPSRINMAFPNINLRIDLATCQFISVD